MRSYLNPAKGGFRINEKLPIGLRTTICTKFNDAGRRFSKVGRTIRYEDAEILYQGLPGQGEPGRSPNGVTCGFLKLKHGDLAGTIGGEMIIEKREQFRHCSNIDCPICWGRYTREHSYKAADMIWSTRDKLAREGYTPVVYHVVVSPPQPRDFKGLAYSSTRQGWNDTKREAYSILKELDALGGAMFYHPFRENGKEGLRNGSETGNDGDPEHWRYAPHFHAIAIFNVYPPLDRIKAIHDRTGFVINFKTIDDQDADSKSSNYLDASRVKTFDDCNYLANYLYSHIGVVKGDNSSRRLPTLTYIENSHPLRLRTIYLRQGVPLLRQGYVATADAPGQEIDGQPLYWQKFLIDLPANNPNLTEEEIKRLSEVEVVNSAFVHCASYDFDDCKAAIMEEYQRQKDLGLLHHVGNGKYDLDVAELWRMIRGDSRFITLFEPVEDPGGLRNPRIEQADGESIPYLFGIDDADLYEASPEYDAFLREADRREAEIMAELRASRERGRAQ